MIQALIGLALSNLLLSAAVGLLAYALHRHDRYPALAHRLWIFTLIAALAPPVLVWSVPLLPRSLVTEAATTPAATASLAEAGAAAGTMLVLSLPAILLAIWVAGSLVVFATSARRIVRFGIMLRRSCRPAPPRLQHLAAVVGYELDLRTVPSVHVSAARLAPMTWWSGGHVRVVLPQALGAEVDDAQLRWILAHELAHIKRRDHLVRWLEWLASVAFWWNPVVWWARRNLRRDEEDACDALVLARLQGQPRAYARTLLTVVEVMAAGGTTPALATGLDAARSLEHRLTRIVSPGRGHQAPRAVAAGSVAVALLLMTVGVGIGEAAAPSTPDSGGSLSAAGIGARLSGGSRIDGAPLAPEDVLAELESDFGPTILRVSGDLGQRALVGTDGPDTVRGSRADENIKSYAGGDTISGGGGRDTIDAGRGADVVRGGHGADILNGGRGRDRIGGGAGSDTINGGSGADVIQGGGGEDIVSAGPGNDIVRVWADGTPDVVDCGGGEDKAVIGSTDTARRCETVVIRDPS